MKELKKKIINYLVAEYCELDATQQVCFAEEIVITKVVKIVYDNGTVEYLEEVDDKVIKFKN